MKKNLIKINSTNIVVIAVSKKQSTAEIEVLHSLGFNHFAENRVLELKVKNDLLKRHNLKWHFIGNIQSNEIKDIVKYSDIAHSVKRQKEVHLINKYAIKMNKQYNCFIQVNISGESSKSGVQCHDWENNQKQFNNIIKIVSLTISCTNLKFLGIMTIAPLVESEDELKVIFSRCNNLLREIEIELKYKKNTFDLSMGMSKDYKIAIKEGADWLRIGSLLFQKD